MRRVASLLLLLLASGCPAPRRYAVAPEGMSCERATRVAYRTMEQQGFTVTRVVEATRDEDGLVEGTRPGADPDARPEHASVRILCRADGVIVQPVEGELVSSFEFSRGFGYSFKELAKHPDVEQPTQVTGLQVLVEDVEPPQAAIELGGWPLAGEERVLVRVTVRNGTERPVELDAARILLAPRDGSSTPPLPPAAAAAALAPNARGADLRAKLLGRARVPAGETVTGFLVFPRGDYADAQVAIEDVETGETDGFSVPVQ